MKTSGVPAIYREAEYERCSIREELDEWAADAGALVDAGKGVLLFGGAGTGKSMTAALAVAEILKAGKTAKWAYVPDLCDQMLRNPWTRAEMRDWHMAADVLVLDDLGVRPLSQLEVGMLDQIAENRYRRRKSVIVTTNIDADRFKDHDELIRMRDRWRQCCRGWVIGGKSRRMYA